MTTVSFAWIFKTGQCSGSEVFQSEVSLEPSVLPRIKTSLKCSPAADGLSEQCV